MRAVRPRVAVAVFMILGGIGAGPARGSDDLQGEITRLEGRLGQLSDAQSDRLAEIYFLTSRCGDVLRVYLKRATPSGKLLLCACGGKCPGGSELERLVRFRRLLEGGGRWNEAKVQALWRKLESVPEARYWALKRLRATPAAFRDARLRALRVDLEKSLESLEVKP